MKSKTLRRELAAALVMLLASFVALSSSTFAWFASNNNVSAENMTVTAECDVSFLEIGNERTKTANGGKYYIGTTIKAEADTTSAAIKPVTPFEEDGITLNTTGGSIASGGSIVWSYTFSDDVKKSAKASGAAFEVVSSGAIKEYVLDNAFYIRMAGVGPNGRNFKASSITCSTVDTNSLDEAVRVLIVGKNGHQLYDCGTGILQDAVLISNFTYLEDDKKTDDQTIHVYVYYEGSDDRLFTDNLPSMEGVNVSIEFTAENGI